MQERTVAPFGAWRSQIRIEDIVGEVVVLSEPWIDGDDIYWLEGRPTEGGRRVLVRAAADGSTTDMTPAPANVRSRVHEYGGGSYVVAGGIVVYSEFTDGRLYRLDPGAEAAVPSPRPGRGATRTCASIAHAAGSMRSARTTLRACRSTRSTRSWRSRSTGEATVLVDGPDFVAAPRLSPDGGRLAWLEWDHPDMPWDATRLRVAPIAPDGTLGPSSLAAGGPDESIVQPEWAPDGTLHLVSDRTGWWNLYRLVDGPRLEPLAPMEAEFADPAWIFGRSSYGFASDGAIATIARSDGRDHLYRLEPGLLIGEIDVPFTELEAVQVGRTPSWPWPARRPIPRSWPGSIRRRSPRLGSCAGPARWCWTRRRSPCPSRSSSRRPGIGRHTRTTTRRRTRPSSPRTGSCRRSW